MSPKLIGSLLQDLYGAAAEPERWEAFLQRLKSLTGASCGYLLLADETQRHTVAAQTGFDPELQRLYNEHYGANDPVVHAAIAAVQSGGCDWVGDRQELIPDADFVRTDAYNAMMRPMGDFHLCGVMLDLPRGTGALGIRRQKSAAPFEAETISLINMLSPHLKQALRLHAKLQEERSRADTLAASVEAFGIATLAVSATGRVTAVSEAALQVLRRDDGLQIQKGELVASRPEETAALRRLIAGAADTGRAGGTVTQDLRRPAQANRDGRRTPAAGGAVRITRQPPLQPLGVSVTPFAADGVLLKDRPAALVFLHDTGTRPRSRGTALRALYGITPSQARLADLLLGGWSVREAADEMAVAEDTARFHLKSIFRITGTKNQVDLLRTMMSLPGEGTIHAE